MTCRRFVSLSITLMALMVVRAIPAFQAEETAKAVKNKTKKAAKDAADATSKAASTAEKNVKKTTRKAVKETTDVTGGASSTTEKYGKKTTRKAAREQAPGAAVSSPPETSKKATSSAIGTAGRESNSTSEPVNKATSVPTRVVPDSEVRAAKAAGQVWVNTETGVYHKGGRWYGATKQGKFMSESDAVNAGYHAAKGNR